MESALNGTEEHEAWELNSIFMYNLMHNRTLDWPSLTCQWMPNEETDENGKRYSRLLLGTHAENEENKLFILNVAFEKCEPDSNNGDGYSEVAQVSPSGQQWQHDGDVNRARCSSTNSHSILLATRSSTGITHIYRDSGEVARLAGHTEEGYGLSWSPHEAGRLLTAAYDGRVLLWRLEHLPNSTDTAAEEPEIRLVDGGAKAEDVEWHPRCSERVVSCADDGLVSVWDLRSGGSEKAAVMRWRAHEQEANCVSWHPVTEYLLASGGGEGDLALWDVRAGGRRPLHLLQTEQPVYRAVWSPHCETGLLTAGLGPLVHLWDLARVGDDVMSMQEESGCVPELMLTHLGHRGPLCDLGWHPHRPWTAASVSEDNELGIWTVNDNIFRED